MDIREICVTRDATIKQALAVLDKTAKQILMVTKEGVLEGVITDGDIRRWILKNGDLEATVDRIMNAAPLTVTQSNRGDAMKIMKAHRIAALPVTDQSGKVIDLIAWDESNGIFKVRNLTYVNVVIMAGGKGTRLYPYTKILPKPLIPIGETPITERIIEKFRQFGCRQFYLTLNYKKNMIKTYFNDLDRDYAITYVDEDKPLGTAGSLLLMKESLDNTFFMSNCDILVSADYSDIYRAHTDNENVLTIVSSLKNVKIPYGVLKIGENETIQEIVEKPEYDFFVNTGMYVIEPRIIDYIPKGEKFDMTELIDRLLQSGERIGLYPISESSWLDMGQIKEMENMLSNLGIK